MQPFQAFQGRRRTVPISQGALRDPGLCYRTLSGSKTRLYCLPRMGPATFNLTKKAPGREAGGLVLQEQEKATTN